MRVNRTTFVSIRRNLIIVAVLSASICLGPLVVIMGQRAFFY